MADNEFFTKLKPWSKRKHRLLGKYLAPFTAKVGSSIRGREVYCIDGFAGAAKYDDGSEGSPILMAQTADLAGSWSNPVKLKLINVEPKPQNFTSLEIHTKNWKAQGLVTNINSEFGKALPQIIQQIGNAPALFFIDPFGPSKIPFDDIRPILTRPQQITELVINFDADGLRRIIDSIFTTSQDPQTIKSIPAKIKLVTATLGADEWIATLRDSKLSTLQKDDYILNLYTEKLETYGYSVLAYPIRESIDKSPEYFYIYCTRHFDGVELMNDFVRQEEDLIYDEHVEDCMPLFSASENSLPRIEEARRVELKKLIKEHLKTKSQLTRKELRRHLIRLHFAEFHKKDYTQVVKDLIADKILKPSDGNIRINDDSILISSIK